MLPMPEGLGPMGIASEYHLLPKDLPVVLDQMPRISHFDTVGDTSLLRNPDQVITSFFEATKFYIGETPDGQKAVFGISPQFAQIPENVPPDEAIRAIQVEKWAMQLCATEATIQALQNGQLSPMDTQRILGGDPFIQQDVMRAAYEAWKLGPSQVSEAQLLSQRSAQPIKKDNKRKTWIASGATSSDEPGHRYHINFADPRIVRLALAGGVVAPLALAACAPIEMQPTAVVVTTTAESAPTSAPTPTVPATEVPTGATATPDIGTPVGEQYPTVLAEFATGQDVYGIFQTQTEATSFLLMKGFGVSEAVPNTPQEVYKQDIEGLLGYMQQIQTIDGKPIDMTHTNYVPLYHNNTWGILLQDSDTGRFYMPALRNQDGTYQILASLTAYEQYATGVDAGTLGWVLAENPSGIPGQQVPGFAGKWPILGYGSESGIVGWHNAVAIPNSWYDALGRPIPVVQPTVEPSPTPIPTETAIPAPEVYKIEPAFILPVDAELHGYHANFEIVIDQSLANRDTIPLKSFTFVEGFVNHKGYTPAQGIVDGVMHGLWYAWKQNDPTLREVRKDASFEYFMLQIIKGEQVLLMTDDLRSPDNYNPTYVLVDPRKISRIVLLDKSKNTLFHDMSNSLDSLGRSVGIHILENGNIELWTHVRDSGGSDEMSRLNDIAVSLTYAFSFLSSSSAMGPIEFRQDLFRDISDLYGYDIEP